MAYRRRPLSIVVTQVLAVVVAAALVLRIGLGWLRWQRSVFSGPSVLALQQLPALIVLVLSIATFWSLQSRRPQGRWLGAGLLFLVAIGSWFGPHGATMRQVLMKGASAYRQLPPPYLNYSSAAELRGALFASILFSSWLTLLAVILLASGRVREYLSGLS